MRAKPLTQSWSAVTAICGSVLALSLGAACAHADTWDKRTVITVNEPLQIRDTLLEPGTYVLRLLDSPSDRHTVEIFNNDQSHIIGIVIAIPSYRMQPTDRTKFTYWETPQGTATALRDWYYPGDNFGQEFPYPRHPATLTAFLNPPAPAPPTAEPPALPAAAAPPPPPAAPESEGATVPMEQEGNDTAEVAASPAPQPPSEPQATSEEPRPSEAQAPESASTSTALPKTGSPYPMIGLAGFVAIAFCALLRRRRLM